MPETRRVTYTREVISDETRSYYESNDNLDYSKIDGYMIEFGSGDAPIVNHGSEPEQQSDGQDSVGVQNTSQDEPTSRDTTFQDADDDGDGSISSLDEENLSAPVNPLQQPVSGCDQRRSSQKLRTERATGASRMQLEETGVVVLRGDDSMVEKVVEGLGMPVTTKKLDDGTVEVRRAENPGTSQTPKYSLRKNRKTDESAISMSRVCWPSTTNKQLIVKLWSRMKPRSGKLRRMRSTIP